MSNESDEKLALDISKQFLLKLGKELKKIRETKNLKQADVAEAIGRQRSYVSELESGKHNLTIETFRRLSYVYGTKIHEILERVE